MVKNKIKSLKIEKGMFFPEDFKRLSKKTIIYIEKGKLILIK